MVVISNIKNMFWGVTVDSGKRYSQVVDQTFHLSMAALEPGSAPSKEFVQVMVQQGSSEFLLCTLQHGNILQQPLDLIFASGEELAFSLTGKGVVHLTGYLLLDGPEEEDYDSAESDEESDAPELVEVDADTLKAGAKRKAIESSSPSKKTKFSDVDFDEDDSEDDDNFDEDDDDDDDEDDDEDEDDEEFSEDELTFDEDEDSDMESEEDDEPVAVKTPKGQNAGSAKKGKANDKSQPTTPAKSTPVKSPGKENAKTPKSAPGKDNAKTPKSTPGKESAKTPKSGGDGGNQKQNEKAPETPNTPNGESAKKKKKKKKKNKGESSMNESTTSSPEKSSGESTPKSASKKEGTPKIETSGKRRVVAGGTVVEDTKVGHGPEAKAGKMVSVYYVGTLSKSNKQFDSCTSGKPFRFRLKQGEVIKGWDNGVEGMKVGGKRKITVPANQAYGNQKQGPIPANSALTFEVELKAVS